MVSGNGVWASRKNKAEFNGQKVYYEQLDVAGGLHSQFVLLEDPMHPDDDNDPAQALDSTVYASADAGEVLAITATFINPHTDIRYVMNQAVFSLLVECGTNARITRVTGTLGMHQLAGAGNNFTAIGSEIQPTNFANLDGAASRRIRGIIDDIPRTLIPTGWLLAFRVRVYGYRTAGAVPVPITLWHERGTDNVQVTVDALKEEI